MKHIALTQGFYATVDDVDYNALCRYRWKILKTRDLRYAARTETLRRSSGRNVTWRTILMHRVIIAAREGQLVDHRDGDGLNNQRSNLRFATVRQNGANSRKTHGKSKYRGVYWNVARNAWQAQISAGPVAGRQKVLYLGRYATETEAAHAYNLKASQLHGAFAGLNTLPPGWTAPDIAGMLEREKNGKL